MRSRDSLLSLLACAFILYSCAGAPPPAPPAPEPTPAPAPAPAPAPEPAPAPAPEPAPEPAAPVPENELSRAKELRAYILENGLDALAPTPFKQAEDRFAAAEKVYGSDNEAAKKGLSEAITLYEKTIADGFGARISQKRSEALAARRKADGEKAKVAAKEPYAAAEASFSKAASDASGKRYKEAVAGYEEAAKRYEEAAALAADRRAKARAALDSAAATIQSTEERITEIDAEMQSSEGGAQ